MSGKAKNLTKTKMVRDKDAGLKKDGEQAMVTRKSERVTARKHKIADQSEENLNKPKAATPVSSPKKSKTRNKCGQANPDPVQKGQEPKARSKPIEVITEQIGFDDDENYVSMQASGQNSDNFFSDHEEGECSAQEVQSQQLTPRKRSLSPDSSGSGSSRQDSSSEDKSYSSNDDYDRETSAGRSEWSDCKSRSISRRSRTLVRDNQSGSHKRQRTPAGGQTTKDRKANQKMENTMQMMQNFMIQQGFINQSMDQDEIRDYLKNNAHHDNTNDNHTSREKDLEKGRKHKGGEVGQNLQSPSEVTLYKDAVKLPSHDTSGSSEGVNNTSDDSIEKGGNRMDTLDNSLNILSHISGVRSSRRSRSRSRSCSTGRRCHHHHHQSSSSREARRERRSTSAYCEPGQDCARRNDDQAEAEEQAE